MEDYLKSVICKNGREIREIEGEEIIVEYGIGVR
jgi:hypothetical protein